jgi:hypothetical protein
MFWIEVSDAVEEFSIPDDAIDLAFAINGV